MPRCLALPGSAASALSDRLFPMRPPQELATKSALLALDRTRAALAVAYTHARGIGVLSKTLFEKKQRDLKDESRSSRPLCRSGERTIRSCFSRSCLEATLKSFCSHASKAPTSSQSLWMRRCRKVYPGRRADCGVQKKQPASVHIKMKSSFFKTMYSVCLPPRRSLSDGGAVKPFWTRLAGRSRILHGANTCVSMLREQP